MRTLCVKRQGKKWKKAERTNGQQQVNRRRRGGWRRRRRGGKKKKRDGRLRRGQWRAATLAVASIPSPHARERSGKGRWKLKWNCPESVNGKRVPPAINSELPYTANTRFSPLPLAVFNGENLRWIYDFYIRYILIRPEARFGYRCARWIPRERNE